MDPAAALDRLEVGGRGDRPKSGHREPPADVVVRLPVDDLLERRQPARHALGHGPDAAPTAGRRLLDDDAALPNGVRSAGDVRWAQTTAGSAATVASRSRTSSAVGDVEAARGALGLPARLEVERERGDLAEVLDRLLGGDQAERVGSSPRASTRRAGEQREAGAARRGGRRALEQPVDEDDVGARQLVATGDPRPDVRAVVDEQLEVEPGRQPARVAVAARRLVDAPQPSPEGEVRGLDRVEQERPVGAPVLDEQEGGVALELGQPERRIEPADDRLEEVAGDRRSVLELAPRRGRRCSRSGRR